MSEKRKIVKFFPKFWVKYLKSDLGISEIQIYNLTTKETSELVTVIKIVKVRQNTSLHETKCNGAIPLFQKSAL